MKIVVIGGTGLIGSKTVPLLRRGGHAVVSASPPSGTNTITGEGLNQVMARAQVAIDLTNSPSSDDRAVLEFFEMSGRNLLAAETVARVRHHVALSIAAVDRTDNGYFRAKVAQETPIVASGIPYTIIRAMARTPPGHAAPTVGGNNLSASRYEDVLTKQARQLASCAAARRRHSTVQRNTDFQVPTVGHSGCSSYLMRRNAASTGHFSNWTRRDRLTHAHRSGLPVFRPMLPKDLEWNAFQRFRPVPTRQSSLANRPSVLYAS